MNEKKNIAEEIEKYIREQTRELEGDWLDKYFPKSVRAKDRKTSVSKSETDKSMPVPPKGICPGTEIEKNRHNRTKE